MDIYPAIDLKGGKCVRLSQGRFEAATIYSEDPVKTARRWKVEGAHRLHIVDLDGARKGSPSTENLNVLRDILRHVELPVQFGGGVRSAEVVERMLRIGVQRVVVGTAIAQDAALARGLFAMYGERVVVGADAREGMISVQAWQSQLEERAPSFMARMARLGARRFVFTDIGRDGMLQGINLPALAQAAAAVPGLPVIASGGLTTLADLDALLQLRAADAPGIEGVIVGKALYAGTVTLPELLERAQASDGGAGGR